MPARSSVPPELWREAERVYADQGLKAAHAVITRLVPRFRTTAVSQHMAVRGIKPGIPLPDTSAPEPEAAELEAEVRADRRIEALTREVRIWRRKYEESIKRASIEDTLAELLRDYRQAMPVPKLTTVNTEAPRGVDIKETIVLLLTDLHVGETVDGTAMHGVNRYDVDVFLARIETLYERMISICFGALRGYKFEELRIYCLGDLINGSYGSMHDELIVTEASNLMETVYGAAYVLVQFVARMLEHFERIVICAAPGNHGRMVGRKNWAKLPELNWDLVVPQIASTYFAGEPRVQFKIPQSFFFLDEVRGQTFLGAHGHQVRGWAGIPWYGLNRFFGNLTEVLESKDQRVDHVVLGHFHTEAISDRIKGEMIAGPCLKGADEYTLSAGFKPAAAAQTMFGVHAEHGVTHRWRIDVQDSYEPRGVFSWYPGGSLGEIWRTVTQG